MKTPVSMMMSMVSSFNNLVKNFKFLTKTRKVFFLWSFYTIRRGVEDFSNSLLTPQLEKNANSSIYACTATHEMNGSE